MKPLLPFHSINWVDGMKINKDHLIHTDRYVEESIRESCTLHLNSDNFGIMLPIEGEKSNFKLVLSVDSSKIVRAVLHACRAITPGGYRIDFFSRQGTKSNINAELLESEFNAEGRKEKYFFVVLSVNYDKRIPVGELDPEEVPPRIPYVIPQYSLQILPESEFDPGTVLFNGLLLGRFISGSGKIMVDENFIPACTSVKSLSDVEDAYYEIGNMLGETAKNIAIIISKIQEKSQTTTLVKSCLTLCGDSVKVITSNLGSYRWLMRNAPPVYFLTEVLNLAYTVQTSLNNLSVKDREELLNYICEWIEEGTAEVTETINSVIRNEYNHNDISTTINSVTVFMGLLHKIYAKLAQLDFIGKRKGEGAFVQERITPTVENDPKPTKNKGWSFLAD